MAVSVNKLMGMTEALQEKLKARGITNSDKLLEVSATPALRKRLSMFVGVDSRTILELANRADLARIKGVGSIYSDLLEKVGVDTVKELASRRPDNLHRKIVDVYKGRSHTAQLPPPSALQSWVEQAQSLPRVLEY